MNKLYKEFKFGKGSWDYNKSKETSSLETNHQLEPVRKTMYGYNAPAYNC